MSLTDYRDFDATIDYIRQYRQNRQSIRGKQSLRKFSTKTKYSHYRAIYADLIEMGNISTRESKTNTEAQFMKKKLANLDDYTDAIFRTLRESGLIVMSAGRTLRISTSRKDEVTYILTTINRNPLPDKMSRDQFDAYMFNPELPQLLNDNKETLKENISLLSEFSAVDLESMDVYSLKASLAKLRRHKRKVQVNAQALKLKQRREEDIQDIINTFKRISDNEEGRDGPLMLEWNMWRAITMIDHGSIKGNFIPDDNGMPISTASGNQGDIVGDYGDFQIIVEVTRSTGKRQYDMESEPVTRHIGEIQTHSSNPVFGMFVAEKLTPSVINYFWVTNILNHEVYNGSVDIIPMNLDTFIAFFKGAAHKVLTANELLSIHKYSTKKTKETANDGKTEHDWHQMVLNYVASVSTLTTDTPFNRNNFILTE